MAELNVCDPLAEAAKKLFGLHYLFPYQRLVISNLLEAAAVNGVALQWPGVIDEPDIRGEDTELEKTHLGRQIVILPTGAGKSLCFQLPAMLFSAPTLVIYPILSLMADQERRLAERGFYPVVIRGGQSDEERGKIWEKIRSGKSKFIIANPEVLLTPRVRERLPELGIVHTVIDEAHCVSEWGESFRPSYLEIHTILKALRSPLVTAFTATASDPVLEHIERYIFGGEGAHRIVGNPDRPNIEYRASGCILRNLAVKDLLLTSERPAIVFCSSRPGAEQLAKYLRNNAAEEGAAWAREIRFYHAGLSREEKKDLETWYLHNTEAVLVSTCAFGLGVDKADIRTVIHRDCPPSVEAYLQESGRAGRDGKQSRAILLWGPEDEDRFVLAKTARDKARLKQLFDYARDQKSCRREALLRLLNYEGESGKPKKQCCDHCSGENSAELREEKSLRDFFKRNNRCYTAKEAARVLGELGIASEKECRELISVLMQKGILAKCKNPFWKNKLGVKKSLLSLNVDKRGAFV